MSGSEGGVDARKCSELRHTLTKGAFTQPSVPLHVSFLYQTTLHDFTHRLHVSRGTLKSTYVDKMCLNVSGERSVCRVSKKSPTHDHSIHTTDNFIDLSWIDNSHMATFILHRNHINPPFWT